MGQHDTTPGSVSDEPAVANSRAERERQLNLKLDAELLRNPDKFPKAVYFIIPNEFCERFCFYGIKNLLNLYLKTAFGYTAAFAKSQVHMFNGFVYAFPLVGAAISDSFLGKYHTIVILSFVYLIGNLLLSIFSINNLLGEYGQYPYVAIIIPLLLIAIGTGGIKPCVSSHGGDQFLPSQTRLLDKFFSLFYVSINVGALIAQYLTPFLKDKVECFGAHCYFLAFGIPTIFFALALGVFMLGFKFYRVVPPTGEFLPGKAIKTTWIASSKYFKANKPERQTKSHWLQFAESDVGAAFVEETRLLGKVIVMFIPLIFFWVLYDQNGTEWQNQYEKMNHMFLGFIDMPTEASSNVNSVLIIILVPFLSYVVYPFLDKHNLSLSIIARMVWGFFFVILSFIIAIILQIYVDREAGSLVLENNAAVACPDCINGTWQLPQWFFLSLGEAMLSPTGVQFAYTQVGPQMKASATSLWLLTTALGNYVVMAMEFGVGELSAPLRMGIYVIIATVFLIIFIVLSKFWFVSKEEEDRLKLATTTTNVLEKSPSVKGNPDTVSPIITTTALES